MKKRYLLPVFMVAGFVSLALADPCTENGQVMYCQWDPSGNDPGGCYEINSSYGNPNNYLCGNSATADLTTLIGRCVAYGSLFTGVTGLNEGNNYGDNLKCLNQGGTWTNKGKNPNVDYGFCDWGPPSEYGEGGCWSIKDQEQLEECQAYGTVVSSCPSPIRKIQTGIAGLVVVPNGRALHISSDRDASITLYDLNGNRVFGGKVRAGNSVFSLTSQAPGVYYAVVQSGSLTQTANVVLK